MIASLSGKGGTGKTSMAALILDELARKGYSGRVLAVDGDPVTTLHLALGFPEPAATLAGMHDAVTLDAVFALETGCLAVDARVARLGYGDDTRSYFDRLTLSLTARQVDEVVMPMDA